MTFQQLGRDTTSVDALAWSGSGFGDATADTMWSAPLKNVALSEIAAGNIPASILRNDAREIVVLSFRLPPVTPRPKGKNALFLARSTWNGLRQLSFRVHDPELANDTLQSLLADKPHARFWEFRMHNDREWHEAGYIFKLFPLANGSDA